MIRKLFSGLFLIMLSNSGSLAQNSDRELIIRVADHVIRNTEYKFINKATGETYSSTKGLPPNKDITIKDQYNYWMYPNAIICMAMNELNNYNPNEKYRLHPVRFYDFFFSNTGYLKKQMDAGHSKWEYNWFFRMTQLDDCGPHAAGLIDVMKTDPKPEYKQFIERTASLMFDTDKQLKDGTWVKTTPVDSTVWIDDLFMGVTFLAKYGHEKNESKYFDLAVKEVLLFEKYCYDPLTELYFHNYYSDLKRPGIAHWGRANGWCILAKLNLLKYLPADHPQRNEILRLFERQVIGFAKYQSESGLWHQLLDKNDSFLETSCSAIFTYAVAKAVNEGWIDKRYSSLALSGWKGVTSQVDTDGGVLNVCKQTGISDELTFYYQRERPYNDFHATGVIILGGLEIIKLKESLKK